MDKQQQQTENPDQAFQFTNTHQESNQQPIPLANQSADQSIPASSDSHAKNSNNINAPDFRGPGSIYEIAKDTLHPHLGQDPNLMSEDVQIQNMNAQSDSKETTGSPGSIHSIFFSQLMQKQNEARADLGESEEIAQFQRQFANMDLIGSQNQQSSVNMQLQPDLGPNQNQYQGYQNTLIQPGHDNQNSFQSPSPNMQQPKYSQQQMQMMMDSQYQRLQNQLQMSLNNNSKDASQYMTPNKMNMHQQMFPNQQLMTQKSEMTPNISGTQYFNQGINDVYADDNDLKCNQQQYMLQQNAMIKQTTQNQIPRQMSDMNYQKQNGNNNQNVYYDENVGVDKLVELQEPSESNSTFNQNTFHAQIETMLNDEEEDDSHTIDPSFNSNMNLDQFNIEIGKSPSYQDRSQMSQKQMMQYSEQNNMLFNRRGGSNEVKNIPQYQNPQLNYINQPKNQIEFMNDPSQITNLNNNQNQSEKNMQHLNQRVQPQQHMNMATQMMKGRSNQPEMQAQYQNTMMMKHMAQKNHPSSQRMGDGMMLPPSQLMNQPIEILQQQMQPQNQNSQSLDQNSVQMPQNMSQRHLQYQQMPNMNQMPQNMHHQQKMQFQQLHPNQYQENNSDFLQKIKQENEHNKGQKVNIEHQKYSMGEEEQLQYFDYNVGQNQNNEMYSGNKQMNQSAQLGGQQLLSPSIEQQQHYESFQYDQSQQYPKYQIKNRQEQQQIPGDMQRMMNQEEYQMMQMQLMLNQKLLQSNGNNSQQAQQQINHQEMTNQSLNEQQRMKIFLPATVDPNFNAFYPSAPNQTSNANNQSQYLQQKQFQMMSNQLDLNDHSFYQNKMRPMNGQNNGYNGQNEYMETFGAESQPIASFERRQGGQMGSDESYVLGQNSFSPQSQMQKRKVPSRHKAFSEKEGYPQTGNFIEESEQIENLKINHLSSSRKESRIQQSQASKIFSKDQPKGRTRRTGSNYVQSDKPLMIPVEIDIDIENQDQDQSSQGTSKNKSRYSSGSKQTKEGSRKANKKNKNSSSNQQDNDYEIADKTNCSNSGVIDTDSGQKPNSFNEHQSYSDSRGIGQRSRGGNSNSSKSGHHSLAGTNSHTSNQSYDEFIQQIQHDVKKANKDPEKEFQVLNGHIIKLATKKVGSKFLQEHLSQTKQSLINKIIDQIDGYLPDLMTDNYGNYFCSELIKYLQVHQRIHFMKQIKGHKFIEISCNNRGTYTLQNIIYAVTQPEEFEIIKETLLENDNICNLAKDKEGHHMLEKIITTFNEKQRFYIFQEIIERFNELATDKNGLCVLKKLIQHTKDENCQKTVINKILENGLEYVQNAFGNFVVSEVLNQFSFQICKDIFLSMKGHFVRLSQNKFSSKFIEVCIDKAPINIQNEIIQEFCESPYLHRVVQSQFGNFVLQNSIASYCKTDQQRNDLIHSVIISLQEVTDYKVQVKWGQEILINYIQKIQNESEFLRLNEMIKKEMSVINQKHQLFKQQQHIQMQSQRNVESYSNHSQPKGRKNSNNQNQGNQYAQGHFQSQMNYSQRGHMNSQEDDSNYINPNTNWNYRMNQSQWQDSNNQDGHYQKQQYNSGKYQKNNSQYGSQKGKNQKNKKAGNNKNQGQQASQNYNKQFQQYQGKPLTLKKDNIQYANPSNFNQENTINQNRDFSQALQANQDEQVNHPNLNQPQGSSRNSGIRSNSIFTDDPTGLNQGSSGGTSEKANKELNSTVKPNE